MKRMLNDWIASLFGQASVDNRTSAEQWNQAAQNWIEQQGGTGDWIRSDLVDRHMFELAQLTSGARFLDVGCGDGRFVRLMSEITKNGVGIDISENMIARARSRDPDGYYEVADAVDLPFEDCEFDVVICYGSLANIEDLRSAIGEMTRVLRKDGALILAHLNSFVTASEMSGWCHRGDSRHYPIDDYTTVRPFDFYYSKTPVTIWHRPLSELLTTCLTQGLKLQAYREPIFASPRSKRELGYNMLPYFSVQRWMKS